jgi:hypothetical protein
MVYKTHKKKHLRHKTTIKRVNTEKKMSYSDEQIGKICSTGQYSTYEGNFYKDPNNLNQFAEIKAKFQKDSKYKKYKTQSERYTKFLTDNFKAGELPKVVQQVKTDFYGYAIAEWLKENDNAKKNYYVQYDTFRIMQEKVYYELIGYVKKYIKENPHSKKAIAISNVYKSLYNDTRKSMFKHVESVTNKVNAFIEKDDMYGLLAAINETEIVIIYTDQLKKSYYNNKNNLVKALNWFYENYQCIDSANTDSANSNSANAHRLVFAYKINDLTIDYYGTTPQMIVEDGELYLKQFYTLTLSIKNNISLQSFKYLIPFLESHEIYNRILRIEFNYDEQFEGIIFKIVLINGGKMDPYVVIHKIKNDVLVFNADNLESGNCIIDFSTDF